jgi:hypothetical protein
MYCRVLLHVGKGCVSNAHRRAIVGIASKISIYGPRHENPPSDYENEDEPKRGADDYKNEVFW